MPASRLHPTLNCRNRLSFWQNTSHRALERKEYSTLGTADAVSKPARFVELDSLRGLAALSVVLHHCRVMWETDTQPASPFLRSLLSLVAPIGFEAVLLFFVLSGFVLSLPAVTGKPQRYSTFVIRRVFRIYVPYLAALAVSVAGALWLHGAVTRSDWFNKSWSEAVNWQLVGRHLLFVGVFDTNQFDNPIWSLIHEMRISLVFPLLCALVLRIGTRRSLALALGLSCAAILFELRPFVIDGDLTGSLHYAAFFVLGILLARHRTRLGAWLSRRRKLTRTLALVAALVIFLFAGPQILQHFSRPSHYWRNKPFSDWITALGAGGLIIISLSSAICKRFLFWKPIRFLGKISYSLYLWHFIVMLYCIHLLYGKMPLGAILCLVLVLTFPVSWCSYRWIELPSIALGRRLSDIRLTRPVKVKTQGAGDLQLAPKQGIDAPDGNSVDGSSTT